MIRRIVVGIFGVVLGVLIGMVAVNPAVVGQDKIERRDRKTDKNVIVVGKVVDESPAGFKVKVGMKDETIDAGDILRVYYDEIPITLKIAYQNLFNSEEKEKDLAKVIKEYKDFSSKVNATPDVKAPLKRYLDFRIAMLQAASADTDLARAEARRALTEFIRDHKASWEYPLAARMLARIQLDKLDFDNAQKVLDELTRIATVPPEIKQEAELLLIDVLFQSNKAEEVRTKINAALANPKTPEALKARYAIYLVGLEALANDAKVDEVIKKLDDLIAKTPDNSLKALAYNIMGDCYLQRQRPRDAMWCYLWVDVVYSQDRASHLKAMTKLLSIFEEEKDTEKVQLYKEKLTRLKQ